MSRINPLKINTKTCSEQRSNVYTQGSKLRKRDNHKADAGPEKMCRLSAGSQKAAAIANKTKNIAWRASLGWREGGREHSSCVYRLQHLPGLKSWLLSLLAKDR